MRQAIAVGLWAVVLGVALVLPGCGTSVNQAPVESRGTAATGAADPSQTAATAAPATAPLPGAENAGKPGYYTVKPGDTLIRIGLDHGQAWKDIARWNQLDNPNVIEVGQVLRVVPPDSATAAAAVAADKGVVTRPVASNGTAGPAPAPTVVAAAPNPPAAAAAVPTAPSGAIAFAWPASGTVLTGFDEARNKGVDIGGKAGDPVLAAADGRVVYAGAGLRGYGNLIILQHNKTFLTAYAHNQKLLVKEDQTVQRGQKIAEMGSSDADRVKLHFEIRREGKPVDPLKYLPAR
ncbi:MAG: peptidase [Comamonas sp. SCN 65-56]|uniref:peptidoglycan DD-metalloendopeptidase family protein n=1 Tax=Comamonas sp. SCN 65-56 TaxID=1660095 RepID=UPI00086D247E|nr:peptidoglycan DD-metalloendopeptidase family protein [Comamonas sp. SCN 65-56]ODS92976.1 MAG: peptidase [Comamonas sp. SCN 65-56]